MDVILVGQVLETCLRRNFTQSYLSLAYCVVSLCFLFLMGLVCIPVCLFVMFVRKQVCICLAVEYKYPQSFSRIAHAPFNMALIAM